MKPDYVDQCWAALKFQYFFIHKKRNEEINFVAKYLFYKINWVYDVKYIVILFKLI
jgi:hypothetical protein